MKRAALLFTVVALAVVVAVVVWIGNTLFWGTPATGAPSVAVVVARGASAGDVARTLKNADVNQNTELFMAYVIITNRASDFKTGTFTLKKGMSIADMVQTLTSETAGERTITLIEGWGIKEMGDYLVAQGAIKSVQDWYAVVGTPPSVAGPTRQIPGTLSANATFDPTSTMEGFLFPDTYRIATNATAEDIAKKMLNNFTQRMQETSAGNRGSYDSIILASIIEREVRSDEDRKIVADIFQRRLKEGMALQADSTVNYVTGKKTPSITSADRDIDSPWNTYQNRGLPPSPISNPSLSAIKAVLDPTPNTYVYFLTDSEGRVHYARTFAEHVANKEQYLR